MKREEIKLDLGLVEAACRTNNSWAPAWEAKQRLIAEYDRLVAQGKIDAMNLCGLQGQLDEAQAENEDFKGTNLSLRKRLQYVEQMWHETIDKNHTLQSHLGRISEPMEQWLAENDKFYHKTKEQLCGCWHPLYSKPIMQAIFAYLDSQKDSSTKSRGAIEASAAEPAYANQRQPNPKPSEKQPKFHDAIRSNIQGLKDYRGVWHEGGIEDCPTSNPPRCEHSDDSGIFWEGKTADCPICNPQKHLCNDGIWEYIPKSECQRCNPPKCEHKNAGMK